MPPNDAEALAASGYDLLRKLISAHRHAANFLALAGPNRREMIFPSNEFVYLGFRVATVVNAIGALSSAAQERP